MRTKKLLILMIFLVAGAVTIRARAEGGPGFPPGPGPGGPMMMGGGPMLPPPFMMALRAANLTDAQQSQLHQILDSSRSQTEPVMKQLHSIHEQIANRLLSADPLTASDLAPLTQQAGQLDQQMQQQSLNTALKIRGILTPEQLAKMNQFNQKMSAIHKQLDELMRGSSPAGGPPML
ncbi:MAG: periplasmic heavy metal sensor [Candidatus Binataceae bacterium]